jgi:hypothetical protein
MVQIKHKISKLTQYIKARFFNIGTITLTRKETTLFQRYGKAFILDLYKLCLLIGLIIPCGLEWLLMGIIKRKNWNKTLFILRW